MNKIGKSNLTFTVIGLIVLLSIVSLALLAQSEFTIDNTITQIPSGNQSAVLAGIGGRAGDNASLQTEFIDPLTTSDGLLDNVFGLIGIFTTAIIGLPKILLMITRLPLQLTSLVTQTFQGLSDFGPAIITLQYTFIAIITVYIFMKGLKALRGTNEEA